MKRPPCPAIPELVELDALRAAGGARLDVREIATIVHDGAPPPVVSIALGADDPGLPAVGFVGGVHGLERIGARVVLAWLRHLVIRLDWDDALHALLQRVRLVFVPIANPGASRAGRAPIRAASTRCAMRRSTRAIASPACAADSGSARGSRGIEVLPMRRGRVGRAVRAGRA